PGEVAELPGSAGRVIVFNVPKYDWSATANPPFVEKASIIGLRQLHVAVRPVDGDPAECEVVVAGDLHAGCERSGDGARLPRPAPGSAVPWRVPAWERLRWQEPCSFC